MANLINGRISHDPIAKLGRSGEFERPDSLFRLKIDPSDAQSGRYHLYVSYACPWAHRTIIARKIKKLDTLIEMSVTRAFMGENGWSFDEGHNPKYLAVVYISAKKNYTGKVSVPVLWDKKQKTIVNNESSEILRIFNNAFNDLTGSDIDLYPEHLRDEIDEINLRVYNNVNNGVYKTGFAGTQNAYEKSCVNLFATLDDLDDILANSKFLVGDHITEADIRLFTTLLRFDPVYYVHFKCNLKQIKDYSNLYQYLKSMYQIPEIRETCHFDHIKEHYYLSHPWINPTKLIPLGPLLDLDSPHDRGPVDFYRKEKIMQLPKDPFTEHRIH